MPELPLTIRLIGLRVTKLKDLRMPEGKGLKKAGSCVFLRELTDILVISFSSRATRHRVRNARGANPY